MNGSSVRQEAKASAQGTIYQLLVAVKKCYDLKADQKLLVEELGDVTIEGHTQIEVKQYSDKLTDGHKNFWNTLKNWTDNSFNHTQFNSLILHSTQEFGPNAQIAEWNNLGTTQRIALLESINTKFEDAYSIAVLKDSSRKPSKVLKHQRFILDSSNRGKLSAIVSKVWIEAKTSRLPDLYHQIQQVHIRGVLESRKEDFLNSLIGFICRADKEAGENWEISYQDFSLKLEELYNTFRSETREFPSKRYHTNKSSDNHGSLEELFVEKIQDIDYEEVIPSAIHHYQATMETIRDEFSSHRTDPLKLVEYSDAVESRFQSSYRRASRSCIDEYSDSQNFYDSTMEAPPPGFQGYEHSPDWFRNGLIHINMNDNSKNFKWRLKKK